MLDVINVFIYNHLTHSRQALDVIYVIIYNHLTHSRQALDVINVIIYNHLTHSRQALDVTNVIIYIIKRGLTNGCSCLGAFFASIHLCLHDSKTGLIGGVVICDTSALEPDG